MEIGSRFPIKSPQEDTIIKGEVVQKKIIENMAYYYIHFIGLNKRYDKWMSENDLRIEETLIELPRKKKKTEDEEFKVKNLKRIFLNDNWIEAWYFSPYPKAVIENGEIYICTFCLYYFAGVEQFQRHAAECRFRSPPGGLIYKDGDICFFEIDGKRQKNYCRNLCLLSKLFLDHKSLYYDTDVFMFYILCKEIEECYYIVGYFSKEKISEQGYNLACILTIPTNQRSGYGKILIDFSYMLSRKDKKISGPEKPLSDLGLLSYRSYWLDVIFEDLVERKDTTIESISRNTFISEDDVLGVLLTNKMIKYYGDELVIYISKELHDKMSKKKKRYRVDPAKLRMEYQFQ